MPKEKLMTVLRWAGEELLMCSTTFPHPNATNTAVPNISARPKPNSRLTLTSVRSEKPSSFSSDL